MTYLSNDLKRLVDEAYLLFVAPAPKSLAVCTACCMSPDVELAILRAKQRDIPLAHLQDWYNAASQDPVPDDVCTYLLPRVLDGLSRQEDVTGFYVERALDRFRSYLVKCRDRDAADFLTRFLAVYVDGVLGHRALELVRLQALLLRGGWTQSDLASLLESIAIDKIIDGLWRDWGEAQQNSTAALTTYLPDEVDPLDIFRAAEFRKRIECYILAPDTSEAEIEKADRVLDVLLA